MATPRARAATLTAMFPSPLTQPTMTPTAARAQLIALHAERLDALESGLAANSRYINQLEADIAASETTYVLLSVGEIASLRADLDGELLG